VDCFSIDPTTGDLFGIYYADSYSWSYDATHYHMFKLSRSESGDDWESPELFMLGDHIMQDPDVAPYITVDTSEIYANGKSIQVAPSGQYMLFCNLGVPTMIMYAPGTYGILQIGTARTLAADSTLWQQYE
jgi:hypothetical protein